MRREHMWTFIQERLLHFEATARAEMVNLEN